MRSSKDHSEQPRLHDVLLLTSMHSGARQVAVKVIQLKTYLHTSLSYRVETRATLFSFSEEMDDVCDSLFGAKLKCETLAKFI
jgi:hypothetical protein